MENVLTEGGYLKLKKELDYLKKVRRKEIAAKMIFQYVQVKKIDEKPVLIPFLTL